jgi:hypothetical protein
MSELGEAERFIFTGIGAGLVVALAGGFGVFAGSLYNMPDVERASTIFAESGALLLVGMATPYIMMLIAGRSPE